MYECTYVRLQAQIYIYIYIYIYYSDIHTCFTIVTSVPSNAVACISVHCISTCPTVSAWAA